MTLRHATAMENNISKGNERYGKNQGKNPQRFDRPGHLDIPEQVSENMEQYEQLCNQNENFGYEQD